MPTTAASRTLAAGVILLMLAVRWLHAWDLSPQARETILTYLRNSYRAPVMARYRDAAPTREMVEQKSAALEQVSDVTLSRVDVRGLLRPRYARVEIQVNGKTPPDGKTVRYFEIDGVVGLAEHRAGSSWQYYFSLW